jgi:hypothetical protein
MAACRDVRGEFGEIERDKSQAIATVTASIVFQCALNFLINILTSDFNSGGEHGYVFVRSFDIVEGSFWLVAHSTNRVRLISRRKRFCNRIYHRRFSNATLERETKNLRNSLPPFRAIRAVDKAGGQPALRDKDRPAPGGHSYRFE